MQTLKRIPVEAKPATGWRDGGDSADFYPTPRVSGRQYSLPFGSRRVLPWTPDLETTELKQLSSLKSYECTSRQRKLVNLEKFLWLLLILKWAFITFIGQWKNLSQTSKVKNTVSLFESTFFLMNQHIYPSFSNHTLSCTTECSLFSFYFTAKWPGILNQLKLDMAEPSELSILC